MTLSQESIQHGKETVQRLLETQAKLPVRSTTPISYYYQQSDKLINEADFYYTNGESQRSFILYSRYITLFVETLKSQHTGFMNVSVHDQERVKAIIRSKALPRAEELKKKLVDKFAADYEANQKIIREVEEENASGSTVVPTTDFHTENEQALQQLKSSYAQVPPQHVALFTIPANDSGIVKTVQEPVRPFVNRSQKPVSNLFRQIRIPGDITPKFLRIAQRNTEQKVETCGILAGIRQDNQYILTHIIVPKQHGGPDSCETVKEEEIIEYVFNENLIQLGWIHTHPTQTAFCSSVDLHTHLPYQMLLQEAIAIVISPKYNETGIFCLTPDVGISVISACTKRGFHEHANNPPIYVTANHTTYDSNLPCQIVDLRN